MKKDTEIIRIEILRILNENGKTRESELTKRVIKKIGRKKMIYREISSLVESGEVIKKIHNKTHIEYELINLSKSVNNQLKNLYQKIKMTYDEINEFNKKTKDSNLLFQDRIRSVIQLIHNIQSIYGILKLLSFYPSFKNDKMFSQIKRKIDDCWELIMQTISQQPEEKFITKVISNIQINQIGSRNVN